MIIYKFSYLQFLFIFENYSFFFCLFIFKYCKKFIASPRKMKEIYFKKILLKMFKWLDEIQVDRLSVVVCHKRENMII